MSIVRVLLHTNDQHQKRHIAAIHFCELRDLNLQCGFCGIFSALSSRVRRVEFAGKASSLAFEHKRF